MRYREVFVLVFCVLSAALPAAAQAAGADGPYPVIITLNTSDAVFRQYSEDVKNARGRLFLAQEKGEDERNKAAEDLTIFAYTLRPGEDFISLAARCNIPDGTLASLNRVSHAGELEPGSALLLPSVWGLFVAEEPRSELERLLLAAREGRPGVSLTIERGGKKEKVRFFPGENFSPTERLFFVTPGFSFPLRSYRLTSLYGPRINPVTGRYGLHGGIDLAAPAGTPVYAAREGTVAETGRSPVYGNYVIVSHGGEMKSLYGHLSKIMAAPQEKVTALSVLGLVGSTGQSTGPHLHFEIRRNGRKEDPGKFLRLFQGE